MQPVFGKYTCYVFSRHSRALMLRAIYFAALFWFALCPGAICAPANGDFESGSTAGWWLYNPGNQPVQWAVTSNPSKVHSGSYAGVLSQFGGSNSTLHVMCAQVNVSGWTTGSLCLAKLYLKTENLQARGGLSVVLVFWDTLGNTVGYYPMNGYFSGDHSYVPVEVLANVPPGEVSANFHLVLESGITAGAAYVDDADIRQVASLGNLSTNLPDSQVRMDTNGSPRLYVNGEVRNPSFFFGNTGSPLIYEEIKLAGHAGVNLVMPGINLPWDGVGSGQFELSLHSNSNAWFLPRVYLHPPGWWLSAHPDQAIIDQNGVKEANGWPSLASDLWMQAVSNQLQQLVLYFHNSPYRSRIIGYHLCYLSGGEWFYPDPAWHFWDYSEVNRQRFASWLEAKYTNVATLNAVWHTALPSFGAVQIPKTNDWFSSDDGLFRNPANQRAVPDYSEYHNNLVAARIDALGAHIKGLTAGKSLVVAFYGYTAELVANCYHNGLPVAGHLGLKQLLKSPSVDILASPISYFDRQVGGPGNLMSEVDSVALAGKLYMQEDDSNTFVVNPPSDGNPRYTNEWDTLHCLRRDYGLVMGHNQAIEWMDLTPDGRFNTNSIWTNNAVVVATYDDIITNQMPFAPQVAVLVDEESFFWLTADAYSLTYPNTFSIRSAFQSCGASVGYYLLEDLPRLPASVKLVVFENAFRLDAAERAMINQCKTNGRTFLWLHAPGYVTETNLSVSAMQAVTGFKLVRQASAVSTRVRLTNAISCITADLVNRQVGTSTAISPSFYVDPGMGSPELLGNYPGNNNRPAFACKDYGAWKSVFFGGIDLDVELIRAIARYAEVNLVADGDQLSSTNAVNSNGNYLSVYSMNAAGRRSFQLPGEKVPNNNFEKFTGAFPGSGFGRWVSPSYGSIACGVIASNAASGSNCCATGPFTSVSGQYSVPLGIRLQAQSNKTYQVSCDLYVDGLNASAAGAGDYIFFVFQPRDYSTNSWSVTIASGTNGFLPNRAWTKLQGSFVFKGSAAPYQNEMHILLKVYGAYSVTNLLLDNVSVREGGCAPVDVVEVNSGAILATGVTGWAVDFAANEQKIFRLAPSPTGDFAISDAALVGPGLVRLQWPALGGNFRYTVQQTDTLPAPWRPAEGTNAWPTARTEAVLPVDTGHGFFRVIADQL